MLFCQKFICLLLIFFQSAFTSTIFSNEILSLIDLNDFIKELEETVSAKNDPKFNGVIFIADENQIYFEKAIGVTDRKTNQVMKIDTQFCVGSLTKQITAALILKACENNYIHLNDTVTHLLPDLKEKWTDHVTLHHLLNHTSGIISLTQPLAFEPGTQFAYSNLGYDVLGMVLEKTFQKTSSQIFKEMFDILDMTSSFQPNSIISFSDLRKSYPKLCQGYLEQEDRTLLPIETLFDPFHNPSGGMISNVLDLHRWTIALFASAVLKSITPMITPSSLRSHRYSSELGYGYGLQISQDDNIFEVSHSGYVPGFISTLLYYPHSKLTVIILENSSWLTSNIKRCFYTHDKIRDITRKHLKNKP